MGEHVLGFASPSDAHQVTVMGLSTLPGLDGALFVVLGDNDHQHAYILLPHMVDELRRQLADPQTPQVVDTSKHGSN